MEYQNKYEKPEILINEIAEFLNTEFIPNDGHDFGRKTINNEEYEVKNVQQQGGEDQGSEYFIVYQIKKIKTKEFFWIKFEAQYNSWDDEDWCYEPVFVFPEEKRVIVYKTI